MCVNALFLGRKTREIELKPILILSALKFLSFDKVDLKTQCLKLIGGPGVMLRHLRISGSQVVKGFVTRGQPFGYDEAL